MFEYLTGFVFGVVVSYLLNLGDDNVHELDTPNVSVFDFKIDWNKEPE